MSFPGEKTTKRGVFIPYMDPMGMESPIFFPIVADIF